MADIIEEFDIFARCQQQWLDHEPEFEPNVTRASLHVIWFGSGQICLFHL